MSSNSILPAFSNNFAKKKRANNNNRSAKLKQSKMNARREQWLSQVKVIKEEPNAGNSTHVVSLGNSEMGCKKDEKENNGFSHERDDEELLVTNNVILVDQNSLDVSMGSFSSSSSSSSSSSESSSGYCSASTSASSSVFEEEQDEDDWEAMAEALTPNENEHHCPNITNSPSPIQQVLSPGLGNKLYEVVGVSKSQSIIEKPVLAKKGHAWKADDAFRPQNLPNLSRFPVKIERCCVREPAGPWVYHDIISQPTSCPICYEHLDLTDSSFLPCSCGFPICLFCHKKLLEADSRCPGCRKVYDPYGKALRGFRRLKAIYGIAVLFEHNQLTLPGSDNFPPGELCDSF